MIVDKDTYQIVEAYMVRKSARRHRKIIQVPIDERLLARIDRTAERVAESRASFVREACKLRLHTLEAEAQDRRYDAGYREQPEGTSWAKASAKLLSGVLTKEKW